MQIKLTIKLNLKKKLHKHTEDKEFKTPNNKINIMQKKEIEEPFMYC